MKHETEAKVHAVLAVGMLLMTVLFYWHESPRAAVPSAFGIGWSSAIVFMLAVRRMRPAA